jgi:hypothetical protein
MKDSWLEMFRDEGFADYFNNDQRITDFCRNNGVLALDQGGCWVFAEVLQRLEPSGVIYGIGDWVWGVGHFMLRVGDEFIDNRGIYTRKRAINIVMNEPYLDRAVIQPFAKWHWEDYRDIWFHKPAVEHLYQITHAIIHEIRTACSKTKEPQVPAGLASSMCHRSLATAPLATSDVAVAA